MYININCEEFVEAFDRMDRSSNFTVTGRKALFEYLEQLQNDTSQVIELDVIALCCEYKESTDDEFRSSYTEVDPNTCEHIIAQLNNGHWLFRNF